MGRIREAFEEPEIEGHSIDYETLPIIREILSNAKLVFSEEEWRKWHISRKHAPIFEAAEKIIDEASRHIPMWDWIEPENTAWQMDRLRIYPYGIDIYDEEALEKLREPERLFAHIHMETVGNTDMYLTVLEDLTETYPDLHPEVLTTGDLWERIASLDLTDGRQHLHICAQIGMLQTGNMLLDYSEAGLADGGYEHPEWDEYPAWVKEAKQADELQMCSNKVLDWVHKNPDEHMKLVIEAVNLATSVSVESLYDARARWARKGLRSQRW